MSKKNKIKISKVDGMDSIYYDIKRDLEQYPDAWLYVIYGGRHRGKTYSSLRYMVENEEDFVFLRRTNKDIETMCKGAKFKKANINLSPFKALNRDMGWNIKPHVIDDGVAGFWETEENGDFGDEPVGWAFSLNSVGKAKGFELASDNKDQFIIFDEFVPNIYDKTNREEGKQVLDFYETVTRDRLDRGGNEIKLICLTNATDVVSPLLDEMGLVDEVADMAIAKQATKYIPEKKVLLRKLPKREDDKEYSTGIYMTMHDTPWGEMTWGNEFAYNDFSNVEKINIKKYTPVCSFTYKRKEWYLYKKDGNYYMCKSRHNGQKHFNLDRENEQKKAWDAIIFKLRCRTIEEHARYESYTMYDLVVNYKKIFKL